MPTTNCRRRAAFTLLEVLIATLILAGLGMSIYELAITSTRGVATDRFTQVERGLVQDLLELFCQPATMLPSLFPKESRGAGPGFSKTLTIDEVLAKLSIPAAEVPTLKATLATNKVEGFTVTWQPRIDAGHGPKTQALRLDMVTVVPVVAGDSADLRVESFRVFAARGEQGE